MSKTKKILIGLTIYYIAMMAGIYFFQHKVLFVPTKLASDYKFKFETKFREGLITTKTGHRVSYLRFKTPKPKSLVIYFHGNAGALDTWGAFAERLSLEVNADVWIMDYPGFGKSSGAVVDSGDELIAVAEEFFLRVKKRAKNKPVVLFGRSLGTGVASAIAVKHKVSGVILETPFYTLTKLITDMFKMAPTFLLRFKLDNAQLKKSKGSNFLLLHGEKDGLIPYANSVLLKKHLGVRAKLISFPEGEHNTLPLYDEYWAGLRTYFKNI